MSPLERVVVGRATAYQNANSITGYFEAYKGIGEAAFFVCTQYPSTTDFGNRTRLVTLT